jgi:hypothetical protein
MPPRHCCCSAKLCEGIIGLYDTGEETSASPCDQAYGIDLHWTANGDDAYAFFTGGTTDFGDPTRLIGCPDVPGITAVCATDVADKAVIEPGGIDGVETVFETEFEILPGTNLDKIAFCGFYTADNYVVEGKWLVNNVDQAHIPHGSFTDATAIGCVPFAITKETAPLVIGTNTIKITVKNGWHLDGTYGGPTFLKLTIDCVERFPCDTEICKTWEVYLEQDDEEEYLAWGELSNTPCPCYCQCEDLPPIEPEYEGQLYTSYCQELAE